VLHPLCRRRPPPSPSSSGFPRWTEGLRKAAALAHGAQKGRAARLRSYFYLCRTAAACIIHEHTAHEGIILLSLRSAAEIPYRLSSRSRTPPPVSLCRLNPHLVSHQADRQPPAAAKFWIRMHTTFFPSFSGPIVCSWPTFLVEFLDVFNCHQHAGVNFRDEKLIFY
jgi:hypothetical protein